MSEEQKRTICSDTVASNPGNVNLKPMVWIKYNFLATSMLFLSVVVSVGLTLGLSFICAILIWETVSRNRFYWLRKKEHFRYGDSNAGIIISTNPMLVAVTTDFTKGFGRYPVIKIIKYKGKGKIGDRIGTVALYAGAEDESIPYWVDFVPIPIDYATDDIAEIQRAIDSYDPMQWQQIEDGLAQVPKPYTEGLYIIRDETSNWDDYKFDSSTPLPTTFAQAGQANKGQNTRQFNRSKIPYMKHINLNAPIYPSESLGGFTLKTHISAYIEDIKSFSNIDKESWKDLSIDTIGPFVIRYTLQHKIILRFDIVTGQLELISALEDYKGKLFGSIGIGSTISEALKVEPRLYYDEIDEGYFITGVDGIGIFLEDPYADHIANPSNKIVEISIFLKESLVLR